MERDKGFVLVGTMLVLVFMSLLYVSALQNTTVELQIAENAHKYRQVFYAAESACRHARQEIDNYGAEPMPIVGDGNNVATLVNQTLGDNGDRYSYSISKADIVEKAVGGSGDYFTILYAIICTGDGARGGQVNLKVNVEKTYKL